MQYPKITIVTPSFNQGQYLEETIRSVIDQEYPNLEYIVIDGGSSDRSIEIIRKYEKYITYWVSEPDKGQSEAINKGLKRATGDLFNWLNSDDYLEKGALHKLAKAYLDHPEKKIFCFKLEKLTADKKELSDRLVNPADEIECYCDPVITQPSMFYKREVINQLQHLNTKLHYCMDYEWWLKFIILYGPSAIYASNDVFAVYRMHPESKTFTSYEKFIDDIATILHSILLQLNMKKYQELLERNFLINSTYSFNIAISIDKALAERMIVYFCLKWGHLIYNKKNFLFAKDVLTTVDFSSIKRSGKENQWLNELKKQVRFKTWNMFRVERKFKWLLKS